MRPPRLRIWMLMALVAAAGLFLGLRRRHERFLELAAYHESRFERVTLPSINYVNPTDVQMRAMARIYRRNDWHREMERKYRKAARYPWLPVETDPPEPE